MDPSASLLLTIIFGTALFLLASLTDPSSRPVHSRRIEALSPLSLPSSPAAPCSDVAAAAPPVASVVGRGAAAAPEVRLWPFQIDMAHLPRVLERNGSVPDYAVLGYVAPGEGDFGLERTAYLFVRNASMWERARSGDVWLKYARLDRHSELYQPLLLELVDVRQRIQRQRVALLRDRFRAILPLMVHQLAYFEGVRWSPSEVGQFLLTNIAPSRALPPDVATVRDLVQAFLYARDCVMAPSHAWNLTLLAGIHERVCTGNPKFAAAAASALGRVRSLPTENVIVGERVAPAAWFEVPQLVARLLTGLHRRLHCSNRDDTEQVLRRAFDLYTNLNFVHPFLDCNGRTLSILLQIMLLERDLPPVLFALWGDVRQELIARQEAAFLGDRSDFYGFLMESMIRSAFSEL